MGHIADDMMRLREAISAGHASRKALADKLKHDRAGIIDAVSEMQADFRSQRHERADQVRNDLASARAQTTESVAGLGHQVERMLEGMRAELDAAGRQSAQDRKSYLASLRRQVHSDLRASGEQRHHRAGQLRADLRNHHRQTVETVADLLSQCGRWRQSLPDLKGQVSLLRARCRQELAEMAQTGAADRRAYITQVRQSLAGLMAEYNDFRQGVLSDLDDLQQAWHGRTDQEPMPPESERPDMETIAEADAAPPLAFRPVSVEDQPEAAAETERADEEKADDPTKPTADAIGDDLTLISGIGPERRKRLNDAGVFTFDDLAGQDTHTLQASLVKPPGDEEIQSWIDQARELTRLV